jgi:hypothetical protein
VKYADGLVLLAKGEIVLQDMIGKLIEIVLQDMIGKLI